MIETTTFWMPLVALLASSGVLGPSSAALPYTGENLGPDCTVNCWSGSSVGCETQEHRAFSVQDGYHDRGAGSHDSCWSGYCVEKHSYCGGEPPDGSPSASRVLELYDSEGLGASAVAALMTEWPSRIGLNSERQALQIRSDCESVILASISLQTDVFYEAEQLVRRVAPE